MQSKYFQDTGILILYLMLTVFHMKTDYFFVFALLCTFILVCSCYFLDSRKSRLCISILFLIIAFFVPSFFVFYPIAFYGLLRERFYIPCIITVLLFLIYCFDAGSYSPIMTASVLFAFLLAFLLNQKTQQYETLDDIFRRTRDDSEERNLLLAEKNKTLLEKQDYEIYTATLRERNRIAREIHDNVGHVLSRSILMVGAMKAVNRDHNLFSMIENLDTSLNSAMNSIRNSVHDLHDEAVNLKEVILSLTEDFSFCRLDLQYDFSDVVPRDVKYCFISITKEALSNIIKHSNATHVLIVLREHPALYQLCIEDNGTIASTASSIVGQTNQLSQTQGMGIGISNMRERVYALKGNIQISTEHGFKIFITIPKGDAQ